MTMLDTFTRILQDGMIIDDVKEYSNKYKIALSYKGMKATTELEKLCTPGNEKVLCMRAIDIAISNMYVNVRNLEEARAWLNGERWNDLNNDSQKNYNEILNYLELSYDGAVAMNDNEIAIRLGRAIEAFKQDVIIEND